MLFTVPENTLLHTQSVRKSEQVKRKKKKKIQRKKKKKREVEQGGGKSVKKLTI